MPLPVEIAGQRYLSLVTFRKNGAEVATPVWFGEANDRLYVMTLSHSGKVKRLRNNSASKIAPCTIRGRVTGPHFAAVATLLPPERWEQARKTITAKYLLARLSRPFSRADAFIEIKVGARLN